MAHRRRTISLVVSIVLALEGFCVQALAEVPREGEEVIATSGSGLEEVYGTYGTFASSDDVGSLDEIAASDGDEDEASASNDIELTVQAEDAGLGGESFIGIGAGTKDNPYLISTEAELDAMRHQLDACYALTNDIEVTAGSWVPVGSKANPFCGSFDGAGFQIKGLTIDETVDLNDSTSSTEHNYGLFGYAKDATISGLGLEDIDIDVSMSSYDGDEPPFVNVGGLIGEAYDTSVSQCSVSGSISLVAGKNVWTRAGGLCCCGRVDVDDCSVRGTLSGAGESFNTMVGGFSAYLVDSRVSNSFFEGALVGQNPGVVYVGGINASGEYPSVSSCLAIVDTGDITAVGNRRFCDEIGNFSNKSNCRVLSPNDEACGDQSTYNALGWDCENVWLIEGNRPILRALSDARDEHYPSGYVFKRDSYSFENFEAYIPYGYWATMFESGAGKLCWKNWRAGGLCYGMTFTTASILASQPEVTSFVYRGSESGGVRDLVLSSTLHGTTGLGNVGSVAHLNSSSDIPIDSFIKYAHIFQYSTEATDAVIYTWWPERNVRDMSRLLNAVRSSVNSGSPCVTIKMVGPNGGHRVLAIGYDGNDILIDDPNNTERPERLTINDDGTWEFSGYGGFRSDAAGAILGYTASRDLVTRPWRVLAGGNATLTGAGWAVEDGETLIGGMAPLDSENTLVRVDAEDYRVTGGDVVELGENSGGNTLDGGVDTEGMCWVLGTNEVSVSDVRGGNGTVEVGADNALITASVPDGATVTASVDESNALTTVEGADGKPVSVSVDHIDKDGSDVTTTITGVARGEVDVAREGDTVVVSGASDVTVTLETPEGTSDVHADAPDGGELAFGIGAGGAIESLLPISEAVVKPVSDKPYTGKAITPNISVTYEGRTLKRDVDYEVSYSNNVNVGEATITITGIGSYAGAKIMSFRITKIGNAMVASAKKAKVSTTYSAKKARKMAANVSVSKAQGTVTYVNASTNVQASRFTVDKITGKLTLAKGTKAGTYPVKIKVTATGDVNHKAMSKTVSFKVVVGKASQPMKVVAVKRSVKHSSVKKNNVTAARPIRFATKAQGKVAYEKVSGAKCLSVNAKTGKVTVKRGTRKGTYKAKIKVTAKGTKNYKTGSKSVTCAVVVK